MVNTGGQMRRSLQRLMSVERKVTFDGREKVQLERVERDEFSLPSQDRVADYDAEKLASFWNKENNQKNFEMPSISSQICNGLKEGFLSRTTLIISIYLILHYSVNLLIVKYWCTEELLDPAFIYSIEQSIFADNNTIPKSNISETAACLHYKVQTRKLVDKEALFSKILKPSIAKEGDVGMGLSCIMIEILNIK